MKKVRFSDGTEPRDPIRPPSYFFKVADLYRGAIAHAISLKSSTVLNNIAVYHLRVARALYSAGFPSSECKAELEKAASYFTQHLSSTKKQPIEGIPILVNYLENMAAACLTDTMQSCIHALEAARIEKPFPWQQEILSLIANVFQGENTLVKKIDGRGAPPEFGPQFITLFVATMERDRHNFHLKLENYIKDVWAPPLDRDEKYDLISKPPSYTGKWAFFAAALCKVMGEVPSLSKKSLQYVPVELIDEWKIRGGEDLSNDPRKTPRYIRT